MRELRSMAVSVLVIGLPIAAVRLAAVLLGSSGPAAAGAEPQPLRAPSLHGPPPPPRSEPAPRQRAAATRIAELRELGFGPSPLLEPAPPRGPAGRRPDDPAAPPQITVSAILRAEEGNIALIGRRWHVVGDECLDTDWVVAAIDAHGRSVTLIHPPTGRRRSYAVPSPRE